MEATVHEYIGGEKDAYIVALDDGKTRKQVPAAEVRPYEPKPVEDPEADAAILLDIALDAAAAEAFTQAESEESGAHASEGFCKGHQGIGQTLEWRGD